MSGRAPQPCPYCGCIMVAPRRCGLAPGRSPPGNMRTRDHIMPRAWGGSDTADNRRPCCSRCNQLRATVGHCVGALACVLAVSRGGRQRSKSARYIVRAWRLPTAGAPL